MPSPRSAVGGVLVVVVGGAGRVVVLVVVVLAVVGDDVVALDPVVAGEGVLDGGDGSLEPVPVGLVGADVPDEVLALVVTPVVGVALVAASAGGMVTDGAGARSRNGAGSTKAPSTSTSKCRWHPVDSPVLPT